MVENKRQQITIALLIRKQISCNLSYQSSKELFSKAVQVNTQAKMKPDKVDKLVAWPRSTTKHL